VLNNCPANTAAPAQSSWWLNDTCLPGFTGPDGTACTPCVAGTYKTGNGSAVCSTCPANNYCAQDSESLVPTICPLANSNSPSGSISLSQCQCNPDCHDGAVCSPRPSTAYCPGGSLSVRCPNSGYTPAVAASNASQCACPANGAGICECVGSILWTVTLPLLGGVICALLVHSALQAPRTHAFLARPLQGPATTRNAFALPLRI
jgi:hypothetical protein